MPWFGITSDPYGLQEKANEAVVKFGSVGDDHRTEAHYKATITKAFDQARLKIHSGGVVSIVFGHGDPEAWTRVLTSITDAGLVLTGSWPCSTEKGGKQTGQFIDNTIMMATRAAQPNRSTVDLRLVTEEIREEIVNRVPVWTSDGLADSDQRMAAIAPAMEVVGRYEKVLDFTGQPVPIETFLGLAHQAVEDAADIRIDKFRLVDFDERTRFALSWARLYGRRVGAGSAARWQRLSYDVTEQDVEGILVKTKGGQRLAYGAESAKTSLDIDSSLIDVLFAIADLGRSPKEVAALLHTLGRDTDEQLWAAMGEMARLVGETDRDGQTWTWTVRNRNFIREQAAQTDTDRGQTSRRGAGDPVVERTRRAFMTDSPTPWWTIMTLRPEVITSGGIISDVRMSLHSAAIATGARAPVLSAQLLRGDHPPGGKPGGFHGTSGGAPRGSPLNADPRGMETRPGDGRGKIPRAGGPLASRHPPSAAGRHRPGPGGHQGHS